MFYMYTHDAHTWGMASTNCNKLYYWSVLTLCVHAINIVYSSDVLHLHYHYSRYMEDWYIFLSIAHQSLHQSYMHWYVHMSFGTFMYYYVHSYICTLKLAHQAILLTCMDFPGVVLKSEFVRLHIFASDVCSDMTNDKHSHVKQRGGLPHIP